MNYHGAKITIRDVNLENSMIFNEGWMYVSQPEQRAYEFFAPYFTNECETPGISMISRLTDSEVVRLIEKYDVGVVPPSDEHLSRWRKGLAMLRARAQREQFADKKAILFYLDRPVEVWKPPIIKKSYNEANPPKKIPPAIPVGFSLRFDDLRMYAQPLGGS